MTGSEENQFTPPGVGVNKLILKFFLLIFKISFLAIQFDINSILPVLNFRILSRIVLTQGKAHEWERLDNPVLMATDKNVRWWENDKLYKSTIIRDKSLLTGHKFVMYYNAHGDSIEPQRGAERIGMAVSDDMVHWNRFLEDPVLNHHRGITGDPYIQKIGDIWVMFYFGAFWQPEQRIAFDNFACSRDMVNWTDWEGEKLIEPTEDYDDRYAHKPCVVKWRGVVYHFYCAVNSKDQRGIAVATSVELGRSAK